jgi:deoxyribodipyrimidine photolyase-related protein
MSNATVWIPGDQLLKIHPAIEHAAETYDRDKICVLLIESDQRLSRQRYQRKRLVLLLSAMRHYAELLRQEGFKVDYQQVPTFAQGFQSHVQEFNPEVIVSMACSSYQGRGFQQQLDQWLGIPVEIIPNNQFLVGRFNPIPTPDKSKRYVMEHFYRDMRRHFDILLEDGEPAGGEWNYDQANRKRLPKDINPPAPIEFEPDKITLQVMEQISALPKGIGSVDGFQYAVEHDQAQAAFSDFLETRLDRFGPYEDALTQRSHIVFHSAISPYLNLGLLEPLPVILQVEGLYKSGKVRIESVEGFIRQILGWREFMYWQYWRQMPGMLDQNAWSAEAEVPDFFWDAKTDLACLEHALQRAIETGYNHHIERLMLLSNFMMLTGVNPRAANQWFLSMYIDAYDWVMPPNVIGMGLNADGGLTATKPYIASANYINKMGDFCSSCGYDHKKRHGDGACPFNYLYWNFILKQEDRLKSNPRTSRNVLGLRYLDDEDRVQVQASAVEFMQKHGII